MAAKSTDDGRLSDGVEDGGGGGGGGAWVEDGSSCWSAPC